MEKGNKGNTKKRVVAYIDGFNVYHSIHKKLPDHFKWIDYRKLLEGFLGEDEELKQVFLFTAYPEWNPDKVIRHKNYMQVLSESCGVEIVLGKYKEKSIFFKGSNHPVVDPQGIKISPNEFEFRTFEEKETDVNIAIHIVRGSFMNEYDVAYIVSADSDISPSVQMCRKFFPKKFFQFIFPFKAYSETNKGVANRVKSISKTRMENSLLPDECIVSDKTITCPYKKPESCDPS